MTGIEVCPHCHRPFSPAPKKVCWECKKPISRGHKWFIRDDGRMQHRNCEHPTSYNIKEKE